MSCFSLCFQDGLVIGSFKFASLMASEVTLFHKTNGYSLASVPGFDFKPIPYYR